MVLDKFKFSLLIAFSRTFDTFTLLLLSFRRDFSLLFCNILYYQKYRQYKEAIKQSPKRLRNKDNAVSKSVDVNALGGINDSSCTNQNISMNGLNAKHSTDSLGQEAPNNDYRNVSNPLQ